MDYRQQEVISRAKSLRQRFADSRSGTSSSISTSPLITTRWQSHHHHQFLQEGSPTAGSDALATASLKPQFSDVPTPAGSKSPSPSRTSIKSNEKRPSSVSWMVTNPRGHCSRPGTPTAGYPLDSCAISSAVAAAASLVAVTASSGAQQVRQMSDDFAADLVVEPSYLYSSSKVNLNRRGVLTSFKSKSLDLLGTSRILPPHQLHHHHDRHRTDENSPGRDAAAERRRRLFRRKKANSASCSYDESPSGSQQSRSSSVESNQSAQHAIQRGLEAALKTSTLFAWSSVEASSANQHLLQQTNQPSFVELLEDQLKSGPEMTRIEHLSDLHYPDADPPCHFCSNQSSLSIHDSNRLKIVSGGRVRGRDGSRESINPPYINLPSPNVQDDEHELFPGQSLSGNCHHQPPDGSGSMAGSIGSGCRRSMTTTAADDEETEPPASVLTRRRALVPPKIPPYNMDSSEDTEQSADKETSTSCTENDGNCSGSVGGGSCGSGSSGNSRTQQRRSSFVVIPPMQICPGDLLVYSKVLTQRNSVLDWEGSTQSLAGDTDAASNAARKQKNSWSLLKLFDRSGRTKSESLSGLEEVLTCMQPSNFFDDQLSRYRGLCWMEFLANVQQQRSFSKATKSTLTSTTEEAATSPVTGRAPIIQFPSATPTIQPTRNVLVRQATHQDYSSRIKEWTQEKKARFGLVRTMSERCLDRKSVIQEVLPVEEISQAAEESDVDIPAAANIGEITFPPFEQPQPQQPTPCPPTSGPKCELRGREALWDLFQSECAFLYDHIMVLKNVYMDPLKKIQVEGYAMFAEPELLFGNLDELCCVTYSFCKEFISLLLHHAQAGGGDTKTTHILTKLFQKSSKAHVLSQAYHRYALNYINALNYLETLRRHMEFCEFEKWCNRDPRCKKLQLTDLLVAPVQHIMKVPLLLREIESRTEDVIEKEAVLKILDKEEASLRELDDKMKWLKNFERLLEIQRSLVWPSVLDIEPKVVVPEFLKAPLAKQPCERLIVSPRRQIVLEGPLSLLDTGRPIDMHVILFDDMLLITRKKKGLGKKKSSLSENWTAPCSSRSCLPTDTAGCWRYIVYKQPLSLDRFFLHEINVHEAAAAKLDNGFVIISLNRFQQIIGVHTFQASSDQVKQTWLLKIRETQDHWKRTLQTTVFRAQGRTLSQSPSTIPTHAAVSPNAAAPAKS
ncbi:uncharacterized protein LOC124331523 isoform X2 [Daphnia pulicaria]|uniref:uncharacterized protein LOC124331523 isoform X2 n=1 Tax=Daphnia pulicaria TaxID=35523 RepID=UPI001EE9FEFB|nr:uncharacterized protein LOC124331523 isoform X2 [Daphnia pulicaria]